MSALCWSNNDALDDASSDHSDAVLAPDAVDARLERLSVRIIGGVAHAVALLTPRLKAGLRALGRLIGGRLRGTIRTWYASSPIFPTAVRAVDADGVGLAGPSVLTSLVSSR